MKLRHKKEIIFASVKPALSPNLSVTLLDSESIIGMDAQFRIEKQRERIKELETLVERIYGEISGIANEDLTKAEKNIKRHIIAASTETEGA